MSKASDRLKAAAAAAAVDQAPADSSEGTPAPRSSTTTAPRARAPRAGRPAAQQSKKTRTTIDLSPRDHARLRRWCVDAAEELGKASVDQSKVWRALLEELVTDPELSERIRDRIGEA